mgnify:CR=1 FL=1
MKKIRQISTYSFSRQFTRGKQARSLGPGLLASTQDGILAGDSLASQSSYPSYRRCNRGIPGVMPPSILRIAQKNSAQQSHSRLVNFHFICNPANCHKQKNKCYFQKMLSPESPGGTTSQVSCEFSTFHPPKVWYPPPAGDRPPRDTLRVVTITNTGLLQRQVKQKKLRMLAMPAMARNLSLCPNAS